MPIYEYTCGCKNVTELFIRIGEAPNEIQCQCGKTAYRKMSSFSFNTTEPYNQPYEPAIIGTEIHLRNIRDTNTGELEGIEVRARPIIDGNYSESMMN